MGKHRCCRKKCKAGASEVRALSGAGNNLEHPAWGMVDHSYQRLTPDTPYVDGSRPHPRFISNQVCKMDGEPVPSRDGLNDLLWLMGQLWDHTIVLTPTAGKPRLVPITEHDDPDHAGYAMPFTSSARNADGKTFNELPAFGDAACLYGASEERCMAMRKLDGSGEMKIDDRGLLPRNAAGLPNANEGKFPDDELFLAGDVRANEHAALTAMHTLWAWEHNHWCRRARKACPEMRGKDELVFQMAKRCVNAVYQNIIYKEFVPALLGPRALRPYRGYRPRANATATDEFAACAFRIGHTMVSSTLRMGRGKAAKAVPLRDAFFNPGLIKSWRDVMDLLLGASEQVMQEPMGRMNDEMRNSLFDVLNPETKLLLDLCSANILRGRDHGIANYNEFRKVVGLPRIRTRDISSDPETRRRLIKTFGDGWADNVDAWVGGVCEDHVRGALVGPLFFRVLRDQFERIRDGDRFWCENETEAKRVPRDMHKDASRTSLADVFRRHFGRDCGVGRHALYASATDRRCTKSKI